MKFKKFIITTAIIINIVLLSGCGDKNEDKGSEPSGDGYSILEEDTSESKIQIVDISGLNNILDDIYGKTTTSSDETSSDITTEKQTTSNKNQEQTTKNVIPETSAVAVTVPSTVPSTAKETEKNTNQTQKITLNDNNNNENIGATCGIINISGCTADTAAAKIVTTLISNSMSQEVKVRVLHDYLIRHTFYDEAAMNRNDTYGEVIHTETGALVNRLAVCDGYAKAYKLLCNKAGIECEVVYGKAATNGDSNIGHAWNIVKIDGIWYQIDVTFDDPIVSNISNGEYEAGRNLTHDYYLLTDDIIYLDHTPDDKSVVPKCTSSKYVRCDNMINTEAELEEMLVNLILSNGKQSVYTVELHCIKGNEDLIVGTYLGNAIQNAIDRCVKKIDCMGVNVSLLVQRGGNGRYGSITITINAVWK